MTRPDSPGPSPDVVELSQHYGGDSAFVLAGGGNTSSKSADVLWVKASGHALATIGPDGFVALDRRKLDAMLHGDWPADAKTREALFLDRVMAARLHPGRGQRPSVEALLHHLLPEALVVHTHPGVVNAVTCCTDGERLTRDLFGDDVLWQPYVDPGLILAKALAASVERHTRDTGRRPAAVFLENHGLIVAGATVKDVDATSEKVLSRIAEVLAAPAPADAAVTDAGELASAAVALAAVGPGLHVASDTSPAAAWLAGTAAGRAIALNGPLTPDQIVYCRSTPLWLDSPADAAAAWAAYVDRTGVEPWIAVVAGAGVVAVRATAKLAATTRAVYADAAAVARDATRLGGVRPLSAAHRQFIETWEVEAYRRSVAAK